MGKHKDKKVNLVKVVAPQHVTATDPLVISFAFWQVADLPKEVTVEVIEVDRKAENDDDFTSADDVVVRYAGTLVATADDTAELTDITVLHVTSPARSPDKIWVRLANQTNADAIESGIPFSAAIKDTKDQKIKKAAEFSANEGSFYELAAQVREGRGADGTILVTSAATAVRQRAFVLLAVEPLPQNNSSMKHDAGVRILETFHPGKAKLHQPRNWEETVLRIRSHTPMFLGSAGCSYVIVAMLLRYLRIDAPPPSPDEGVDALDPKDAAAAKQTVRLFDHHIRLADLEAKPDHKPRFFRDAEKEFNDPTLPKIPRDRLAQEREAFVAHFVAAASVANISKTEGDQLPKKLQAFFDEKTKGKGALVPVSPSITEDADESEFYEPTSHPISEQAYLPLLVWRLNVLDDRADSYAMRKRKLNQYQLKLDGASDYRTLGHGEHTQWVPNFEEIPLLRDGEQQVLLDHTVEGEQGKSANSDEGILVPLSSAVSKLFGLISTAPHLDIIEYGDDEPGDPELLPWQRFFVRTLERGLPIVGLFSPGQYSERDQGGHFCMVVGYRYRPDPDDAAKKKIRFIINDPAGGRTHQYEAHDEEELNPEGKDPTEPLKEKGAKELGMKRERRGLNLIIERRKRLSIREVRVYEPGTDDSSSWDPVRHPRFLFFRGKVESSND